MATPRTRYSHSETRKDEHLRLLEQLDSLPQIDSCCEICHCDCYSSHRSSDPSPSPSPSPSHSHSLREPEALTRFGSERREATSNRRAAGAKCDNPSESPKSVGKKKTKRASAAAARVTLAPAQRIPVGSSSPAAAAAAAAAKSPGATHAKRTRKRSKSASSVHSSGHSPDSSARKTRDCQILQELLGALEEPPKLVVCGSRNQANNTTTTSGTAKMQPVERWSSMGNLPQPGQRDGGGGGGGDQLAPLKLCASMANLCLAPTVRQAFRRVPSHDKKILNRMATKRSEQIMAKENAWLARKYWENERYERELLKCEQMEEYKRAVRDKQFQDYLVTKARLDEIAQRDLGELQRLRATLQTKDARARKRLDAIRVERDIQLCQRRCDELRKSEAVTIQQEERQLDETLRKHDICQRLTERLQRADQLRTEMLDSYLRRLRYDNQIEQLLHEENWREAQQDELLRRQQLQEHISRKRRRSQRFIEARQHRNESITKAAKISASLRELVRSSVTPESSLAGAVARANVPLGRLLLLEKPLPKFNLP